MEIDRTRAAWPQIAAEIIRRIRSGEYPPGTKIPSVVRIANEFDVVNSTAQRAMEAVRREGLTRSEKGMGTYVVDDPPR
ncbi:MULTISPECIES: GntR family transcriptional regulator [Streptomyces]|uniref:GntR family transcriptional regulator n=2 Tax=Streptomyces TaxID=1883 RepID=A0A3R7F573_9ACTN|nr:MULTISPECIES: winged helix-turn-helix domain-containing protein [Streptomyces]KNE78898.1 transcriptional regulator [Streptomyces fradiae]OFA39811.1 GntR family transcriptional regulator [Streptomyces fradiae]PQM20456.1 GntR family transcriptional regulator [Streptomyces xinghaiensis]RKM91266.1 GntR family transcriptional regulator [Streptomyces xinghaiensis]RNC69760.1 GntR family transcriptional regulator [Streptomyces xinghaiensis]